jgi:hypothetical protein
MLNQKEFYESDNEGLPSRKQFEKVYDFPFSMSLSLLPNLLYRQTTDCTEGGSLTRDHCILVWYTILVYSHY